VRAHATHFCTSGSTRPSCDCSCTASGPSLTADTVTASVHASRRRNTAPEPRSEAKPTTAAGARPRRRHAPAGYRGPRSTVTGRHRHTRLDTPRRRDSADPPLRSAWFGPVRFAVLSPSDVGVLPFGRYGTGVCPGDDKDVEKSKRRGVTRRRRRRSLERCVLRCRGRAVPCLNLNRPMLCHY